MKIKNGAKETGINKDQVKYVGKWVLCIVLCMYVCMYVCMYYLGTSQAVLSLSHCYLRLV
jgi:hypothetical protein